MNRMQHLLILFFILVFINITFVMRPSTSKANISGQGGAPTLAIPERIAATQNAKVSVPIELNRNGQTIAGTAFSIDFDESCLAFDPSDADNNGVADAITFNLPPQFNPGVTFEASDSDGELDFVIVDFVPPFASLSDDTIVTIELMTTCQPEPNASIIAPVLFSNQPSATFSDESGENVPGSSSDGSVEIIFATPTATSTAMPSATMTATATQSATPTSTTSTATVSPTESVSASPSATTTPTPSATATASATPTATMTVELNNPPDAVDDSATTDEETPIDIPVLANDSDEDNDTLEIATYTQASNGRVLPRVDGTLRYQPDSGYIGPDSFTYTIHDSRGATDSATVSITVNHINHAPDALDDTGTTDEDMPVTIDVLANDNDQDGDRLTVSHVSQGQHGSVSINNNGSADDTITYTPHADYNGTDDFTYTIDDGNGGINVATVEITINPVDDAPNAIRDAIIIESDTEALIEPLLNDINPDNATLKIVEVSLPSNGTVEVNPDQTLTYTPNSGFQGTDQFTYTVDFQRLRHQKSQPLTQQAARGGGSNLQMTTVTVIVKPEEGLVMAADDTLTTSEDTPVSGNILKNDQNNADENALTVLGVTPSEGSIIVNEDNSITYMPAPNAHGSDTFTYIVGNHGLGADTAVVTATISAINDAPHAIRDTVTTNEDTSVNINVLTNDSDLDGDAITVSAITQARYGSVSQNPDNTLTYTPQADVNGRDSFAYTIQDGQGASDITVVSISINEVNDAPDAATDLVITEQGTLINIDVLDNDRDVDGDLLTVTGVTQANHGSVKIHHNGMISYTPLADYTGQDSFSYTVSDGILSTTANVIVTIIPRPVIFLYLPVVQTQ